MKLYHIPADFFKCFRYLQELRLLEGTADELDADRHLRVAREAGGNRRGADASERRRNREEVIQVHRKRILQLLELERRRRGAGRKERVALPEDLGKVARYERTDLLGAPVVGIVITARKHVSSHDYAALHLWAEALGAALRVEGDDVFRTFITCLIARSSAPIPIKRL